MSKTNRKFKSKEYRQGHEPAALNLERIRAQRKAILFADNFGTSGEEIDAVFREAQRQERHRLRMQRILDKDALDALEAAAGEEQKAMGY